MALFNMRYGFSGEAIPKLSMSGRFTMANMALKREPRPDIPGGRQDAGIYQNPGQRKIYGL